MKVKGEKLIDFNLYLITDRRQLPESCNLLTAVKEALKGGVKAIQLREKDLGTRELLRLAYRMRDLTAGYGAKLFINDRVDIAMAVGADGVHLSQQGIPVKAVRRMFKGELLVGVSTHSLSEAMDAEKGGADFITLGPIFRTPSKLRYGPPLGIEILRTVSNHTTIPVFAIGGINVRRIKKVKDGGASGVAMISGVFKAKDIRRKSEEILNLL